MQPLQHIEFLFIRQLRHQGVCRGVACAVHPIHRRTVLRLLVLIASGETEKQAVCPRLIDNADFQNGSLVVVHGMETAHGEIPFHHLTASVSFRVAVDVHLIVVVRIVLVGVQRDVETVLRGMFRIDIALVRVERTV